MYTIEYGCVFRTQWRYLCLERWESPNYLPKAWWRNVSAIHRSLLCPVSGGGRASRNDEARDAIIGLDRRWNLLYVVFIEREDDMIRIISARKATRKEREHYENWRTKKAVR